MEEVTPSAEFDDDQVAKARHLRRVRAANVDADLLDDEDWKTARACQEEEAVDETEREDKEAFNLRTEEAQGHYDEEGYFIFDNQARGVDRRIVWGDKEARQKVKRKLGIDDEEEFVDRKLRKTEELREKMMKHRSQRSLEEKEYSSDEDEPVERTRDAWLDDVDQGYVKEVKQSIIEKRQQEQAELDARLDQRHGAGLDQKGQLRRLIDSLESPSQTPADLMRLIKQRDSEEADGGESVGPKKALKKKKGFQRPRKLSAQAQAKMDTLVDLCDQLTMQGIQVITEARCELERLLAGGSLENEGNEAVESELYS
eukprot:Protomagalhaensia_wolfi_Nauph_80__3119@NODE_318_length_2797_cov_12_520667_g240_i0_p1_GENE_NODE_318_length_2797_cov_12_520667_g240_i0NODE_318_length_2797_cov_12_520667_g240_i0_p1_ORF_typecomplete_len314_score88_44DUF2407_C/PF13373_6/5_3e02DUF2407_C/PF13373_6/1_2_NODE_318_length_2797_cov_12_520667_g240_i017442685